MEDRINSNKHPQQRSEENGIYEREVFVSYAWGGESEQVVDKLDKAFADQGIHIVRDKKDLDYRGSIEEFMQRIGRGQCVILVISDKYLHSEFCMYELLQVSENKELRKRIFPILLSDAQIYKAKDHAAYLSYWQQQVDEATESLRELKDISHTKSIHEDIDRYSDIRANFSRLVDLIRDMNAWTLEKHAADNYSTLIRDVKAAMTNQGVLPQLPKPFDQEINPHPRPQIAFESTVAGKNGRGCRASFIVMAMIVGALAITGLLIFGPSIRALLLNSSPTPTLTVTLTPSPEGTATQVPTSISIVPTCAEHSETRYGFDCGFKLWSKSQDKDMQAVTEVSTTQVPNIYRTMTTVLKITVDFTGDSQTRIEQKREQGEVEVILSDLPPKGYEYKTVDDLAGKTIVAYVWASKDSSGDPNHLNGFQLFIRDQNSNSCYGDWTNIEPSNEGNWFRVVWQEPTMEQKMADKEQAQKENKKPKCVPEFNINAPKILGLKIAVGTDSTKVYNEPLTIYLDDVDWLVPTAAPTP